MSKRAHDEPHGSHKKHKHNNHASHQKPNPKHNTHTPAVDYAAAQAQLPSATSQKNDVPAFIPFKVKSGLPELPLLTAELAEAPFRHRSAFGYDRSTTSKDVTYERLEFLGDAYLEVIASRLIYHHFPQLTAGQQSQLRELLVKNETLAEYSRAYGFEHKLQMADKGTLLAEAQAKGNKGINKILGDTFEAYIAAVVLGDVEDGFAIAEKWLTALWAPKLLKAAPQYSAPTIVQPGGAGDLTTYDPTGKATLQRKIMGPNVKLDYERYKDSVELKGEQLGQNRHYIAVYLTGHGHTRLMLGQGEGKNKVEAGNWAAVQAMHGKHKKLVDGIEAQVLAAREAKKQATAEAAGK